MAIDIVNNLNTKPEEVNQRTAQSATDGAAKMMQEKAGGQGAANPSGKINVMANLGVQQQEQQADNNINQAVKANQQLTQQEGQMNAEQELNERVLSDQELQAQNAYNLQTEVLFNKFERSMQGLDQDRIDFDTQILAQNLRLQNTKYIDELNDIARRENLNDSVAFENKAARVARGRDLAMLQDRLDFERIEAFARQDFKEEIGNEDIEASLAIALSEDDEATTAQNWQNISTGIGGAADAGAAYFTAKGDKSSAKITKGIGKTLSNTAEGIGKNKNR